MQCQRSYYNNNWFEVTFGCVFNSTDVVHFFSVYKNYIIIIILKIRKKKQWLNALNNETMILVSIYPHATIVALKLYHIICTNKQNKSMWTKNSNRLFIESSLVRTHRTNSILLFLFFFSLFLKKRYIECGQTGNI